MRGATLAFLFEACLIDGFQPTLPMRGATGVNGVERHGEGISTHAPHAGSDEQLLECLIKPSNFNPRSPCGERLLRLWWSTPWITNFNPRSPCGERRTIADFKLKLRLISTHAPHAGSDVLDLIRCGKIRISTHAPHAGSDDGWFGFSSCTDIFQPTLPMRGATELEVATDDCILISTHAPHAGSDPGPQ